MADVGVAAIGQGVMPDPVRTFWSVYLTGMLTFVIVAAVIAGFVWMASW
jgi:hypothetical protein